MADPDLQGARDADGRPLPEQATMGLLDYITRHSLDQDYAHVARAQRSEGGEEPGGRPRRTVRHLPTLAVLAAFGLLVATAGIQTARNEPVRESSQESLVAQVQDRRAELAEARAEVVELRAAVERTQRDALEASAAGRTLQALLSRLGVAAGTDAATGPGIRIVVDDSPGAASERQVVLDTDLQLLANGLWVSGAEAVAINNQRLTNLSAIRVAGEAITVNNRSLTRPYVITALGDPDQLAARFVDSAGGTWWLNLRSVYNLQFDMTTEDSLTVPAAPPLDLRHARRPGSNP